MLVYSRREITKSHTRIFSSPSTLVDGLSSIVCGETVACLVPGDIAEDEIRDCRNDLFDRTNALIRGVALTISQSVK